MLAILAALTEVIKTNGGKETSTEYFAALVSKHLVILSYYSMYLLMFFNLFNLRLQLYKQP